MDSAALSPDPRRDEELIAAINAGDPASFDVLYGRYRDWVARLALRFTGDRDLALDVLQETFTYLLQKLPTLRLTAKMTTFLYPAVRDFSIAARRKRARFAGDEEALLAAPAPHAPDPLRDDLVAVLALLPAPYRETLWMRYADGMDLEEIAQALRVPLGTVKSRLHNALGILRDDPRTRKYFGAE